MPGVDADGRGKGQRPQNALAKLAARNAQVGLALDQVPREQTTAERGEVLQRVGVIMLERPNDIVDVGELGGVHVGRIAEVPVREGGGQR